MAVDSHTVLIFFLVVLSFLNYNSFVMAGANGVTFIYPTNGQTFNYLDTINVTYESPFALPLLYIECGSTPNIVEEGFQNVDPYNAYALVLLNWTTSPCLFDLRPNVSAGFGANSNFITILPTERSPAPATIGLSSTSTSMSTTSTATSSPTSTSSPASTTSSTTTTTTIISSSSSSTDNGLTAGAKAGLGVGISFGVLILAGMAAILLTWRKKRIIEEKNLQAGSAWNSGDDYVADGSHRQVHELPKNSAEIPLQQRAQTSELGNTHQIHEMGIASRELPTH